MDQETLLQLAADELAKRSLRYREIEILDYVPTQPDRALLCQEGCVRVIVAPEGDPLLQRVREAVTLRNGDDIDLMENAIKPRFEGRTQLSPYQAWRLLERAPVFATIRYGGRTLATNVFPPDGLGLVVLDNPYNGGALSPTHLTLVEHRRDGTDAGLQAIALRFEPPLTPAERAALAQVPEDQLEGNLTINASCCDNATFIMWAAMAVTVAVICTAAVMAEEADQQHLTDERIRNLGPAATARELLDIRREALGHVH
ncbi:hypothetical protein ACFRAQ_12000 [Nocardia sp. NPDC056611]|uniref:hypothetical protein n=1 Tax=Nocardia sp. NPDC056611 TaxID=3345877 RepID=UPI0036713A9A